MVAASRQYVRCPRDWSCDRNLLPREVDDHDRKLGEHDMSRRNSKSSSRRKPTTKSSNSLLLREPRERRWLGIPTIRYSTRPIVVTTLDAVGCREDAPESAY